MSLLSLAISTFTLIDSESINTLLTVAIKIISEPQNYSLVIAKGTDLCTHVIH